jgi:hypothetical protein
LHTGTGTTATYTNAYNLFALMGQVAETRDAQVNRPKSSGIICLIDATVIRVSPTNGPSFAHYNPGSRSC